MPQISPLSWLSLPFFFFFVLFLFFISFWWFQNYYFPGFGVATCQIFLKKSLKSFVWFW